MDIDKPCPTCSRTVSERMLAIIGEDEPDFPDQETQWVIDGRNELRQELRIRIGKGEQE